LVVEVRGNAAMAHCVSRSPIVFGEVDREIRRFARNTEVSI